MTDDTNEITNLLYRYTELIDGGEFATAAGLFRHAGIRVRDQQQLLDHTDLLALWNTHIIRYPCGTPRTRHVVTNAIVEFDKAANKATARSYYTLFQQTTELPLQIIACGRYHDQFEQINGAWHFSYRDYSLLDFIGDMSAHLRDFNG